MGSPIVKFQSLDAGKYIVTAYEPKFTKFGITYIMNAKFNDDEIEFWANHSLTNYINISPPKNKFEIIISKSSYIPFLNSVEIIGYKPKTYLY